MTPMELALIKMIVSLAMKMGIDPYELALGYADSDKCQEFYNKFASLAEVYEED